MLCIKPKRTYRMSTRSFWGTPDTTVHSQLQLPMFVFFSNQGKKPTLCRLLLFTKDTKWSRTSHRVLTVRAHLSPAQELVCVVTRQECSHLPFNYLVPTTSSFLEELKRCHSIGLKHSKIWDHPASENKTGEKNPTSSSQRVFLQIPHLASRFSATEVSHGPDHSP